MLNNIQTYLTDIENVVKVNNQNSIQIEKLRNIIFQLTKQQALTNERFENEIIDLKNINKEIQKEYFKTRKMLLEKIRKLCVELYKREYKKYNGLKEIWSESAHKTWKHTWYSLFPFW